MLGSGVDEDAGLRVSSPDGAGAAGTCRRTPLMISPTLRLPSLKNGGAVSRLSQLTRFWNSPTAADPRHDVADDGVHRAGGIGNVGEEHVELVGGGLQVVGVCRKPFGSRKLFGASPLGDRGGGTERCRTASAPSPGPPTSPFPPAGVAGPVGRSAAGPPA